MKAYGELMIGLLLMIVIGWITFGYERAFLAVMRWVFAALLVGVFFLGLGLTVLGLSDLKE